MKRIFFVFCLVVSFCTFLFSCGEQPPETIESKSLSLSQTNIIMEVGERLSLSVETSPASWVEPEIFWYTSNPEIVECIDGVLVAHTVGTCTVKAYTDDGISAPTTVIVREGIGKLASVQVDGIGKTLNYLDSESGELLSSAVINSYSVLLERTQSTALSLALRVTVVFNGVKTYDSLGEQGNTPVVFNASTYRSVDEIMFDSPVLSQKALKVGESFSVSYSFTFYSDGRTNTDFRVALEDAAEWIDCESLLDFEIKNVGDELDYIDSRTGTLLGRVVINSYELEYYYYPAEQGSEEYMYVTVRINGRKTYDPKGEGAKGEFRFDVSLYGEKDDLKSTTELNCGEVKNGADFTATYTFKAGTKDREVRRFYLILKGD